MDTYISYEMHRRIVDMRKCLPALDEGSSHRAVAGASQEVDDEMIVSPTLECMQLFIKVCANDLYSHLCNWMFILVIYMLFFSIHQITQLISSNLLCYYWSSHTFLITGMFAAYHPHLVQLNRFHCVAQ